ncbi:MAG: ribosomal-processing cysteine protease Prp [Clostridia bacterium]|nr:ribosomal-processing cysteine protease Prp [Clostridia bacterium]
MTTIEYTHTPSFFGIEFRGHAGFAPAGKDIVCAAVSILASELIFAAEQAQAGGEICDLTHSEGGAFVNLRYFYRDNRSMRQIAKLILASLKMLEAQYGDYIKVRAANFDE